MADMNINLGVKGWKDGSNILDLNIPAPLRRQIRTGVRWFDVAMGGEGLTPSTCAILTGVPGGGKTTAALQLADAITGRGHLAFFNTGEESLYQVRKTAERLKVKNGFAAGQERYVDEVLRKADAMIAASKGKKGKDKHPKQMFLILDSLQTLDDGKYKDGGTTGNTPVRVIEKLAAWCKKTYAIVIVIGQVTKDGKIAGKNAIKHAVDLHAHLYFDMEKKSETYGERLFSVEKNRFGCNGITTILGLDRTGLYQKGTIMMPGFNNPAEEEGEGEE